MRTVCVRNDRSFRYDLGYIVPWFGFIRKASVSIVALGDKNSGSVHRHLLEQLEPDLAAAWLVGPTYRLSKRSTGNT